MADRTNGLNNIDIGSGRRGFRNRNLGLGQAGTVVDAEWANGVQEELIRFIELLGLTPSPSDREQLLRSAKRLAGGNVTGITASGSLTADMAGVLTVSAASGNLVLTLPAASAAGGAPIRFQIIRTDASANTLTIQRAGADTIDGQTTLALLAGQRVTLVSNGTAQWSPLSATGALFVGSSVAFSGGGGAAGFSGNWQVPAYVNRIFVRCWGAGGGGGGSASNSAGAGGGGGAYAEGWHQVQAGVSLTVQAGTGGGAGGVSAAGGNGTGSFVSAPSGPVTGTLLSAGGGTGGAGATTGNVGAPGAGGTASGGDVRVAGGLAQAGVFFASAYLGGLGGAAPVMGGAGFPAGSGQIAGAGGGGGWNNTAAPGAGAGGLVIISW